MNPATTKPVEEQVPVIAVKSRKKMRKIVRDYVIEDEPAAVTTTPEPTTSGATSSEFVIRLNISSLNNQLSTASSESQLKRKISPSSEEEEDNESEEDEEYISEESSSDENDSTYDGDNDELILNTVNELNNSSIDDKNRRASLPYFELAIDDLTSTPVLLPYVLDNYSNLFQLWKHGVVHLNFNSNIIDYHVKYLMKYVTKNSIEEIQKEIMFIEIDIREYTTIISLLYSILVKLFGASAKIRKIPSKVYFFSKLEELKSSYYLYRYCIIIRGLSSTNIELLTLLHGIFEASKHYICIFSIDNKTIPFHNIEFTSTVYNNIIPNVKEYSINSNSLMKDIDTIRQFIVTEQSDDVFCNFVELFLNTHIHLEKNIVVFIRLIPMAYKYCIEQCKGVYTSAIDLYRHVNNFSFHQLINLFEIYKIPTDQNQEDSLQRQSILDDESCIESELIEKFVIIASFIASKNAKQWDTLLDNKIKTTQKKKKKTEEQQGSTKIEKKVNKKEQFNIPRVLYILRNLINNSNYSERFSNGYDFVSVISNLISKNVLEMKKEVDSYLNGKGDCLNLTAKYNYSVVRELASEINMTSLFERYINE